MSVPVVQKKSTAPESPQNPRYTRRDYVISAIGIALVGGAALTCGWMKFLSMYPTLTETYRIACISGLYLSSGILLCVLVRELILINRFN